MLLPDTVVVSPLGTQQFTPYIGNTTNLAITWGIVEGAAGGSVTGGGLYTAPLARGVYHLTVTSQADPTKTATATITVANQVDITPLDKIITVGDTVAFSATVPQIANQSVTWRVVESGGGTITASGLYTPGQSPGIYHIQATSVADPSKSGIATVDFRSGGLKGEIK